MPMNTARFARLLYLGCVVPALLPLHAQQTKPAFESYSVHASKKCEGDIGFQGNRFVAPDSTLFFLMYSAYATELSQDVEGLPAWGESACFTIEARMSDDDYAALQKLPPQERKKQQQQMKQQLLVEVFKLRIHTETRIRPVYEIHQARGGIKIKPWPVGKPVEEGFWGFDSFAFHGTSLTMLATNLTQILSEHVIDQSGLTGLYDVVLTPSQEPAKDVEEVHARLLCTLEEQLGLKLTATKAPITVYVVDHAEKPEAN
jgi:uncharacterized protein (TIGR03435 family)